jgi:hypothetical protein
MFYQSLLFSGKVRRTSAHNAHAFTLVAGNLPILRVIAPIAVPDRVSSSAMFLIFMYALLHAG